jgi:HSP20 family protein
MSNLRVFDPFASDVFDDFFRNFGPLARARGELAPSAPQLKIEVREEDQVFKVRAQVPGVKKEDIHVDIDGDTVSISAETRQEREEKKDGKLLRSEFSYGTATRSFSLGTGIDAGRAQARYDAGVLELTLPKKASAESRRLAVQ